VLLGNGCADESEDMIRVDSDKFQSIIDEVESLHNLGILPTISYLFCYFSFNYILPNCLANKLCSSNGTHSISHRNGVECEVVS
jgi:hypothetical protein